MSKRKIILNAFHPSSEATNPYSFAGRKKEILSLTDSLIIDGSCPIIYGKRGLGKSSLAIQLERIALGDVELLEDIGFSNRALSEHDRYITLRIACSDSIKNIDDLFNRLINQGEGYLSLDDLYIEGNLIEEVTKRSLKLKFFESEIQKKYQIKYSKLSIEEKFKEILSNICEIKNCKVLIIIDELDQVKSTKGLGSFIKNESSRFIKFVLVGVAQNISDLLIDHESLERFVYPVHIERMSYDELAQIIEKVVRFINKEGINVDFKPEAINLIVISAAGFPWFVHVLGQESLRIAIDNRRTLVNEKDVQTAISGLADNRFAQQFSDTYQLAVRDSYPREIMLRLLSKWYEDDISLKHIYLIAKKLGVEQPSVYANHLRQEMYGQIIVKPSFLKKGVVRFKNAIFKRYVDLRNSLYTGVKEDVDKIWEELLSEGNNEDSMFRKYLYKL